MGAKGDQTKEHILEIAEQLILEKGFVGTSIDEIIKKSGITKGGFFYHFDGKQDLAKNLMHRYLEQDAFFFTTLIDRAVTLSEDPLQQMLLFVKLMSEAMADLPAGHPGCLVASFTYESHQFDPEIQELNAQGILEWRRLFLDQLSKIIEKYPLKLERPLEEMADMLTSVIEGGIILSRALNDPSILPNQLLQFRSYLRLAFGVA